MMMSLSVLVRKSRSFVRINWRDKILFFRAFFLSGIARIVILFIPFRGVKRFLGTHKKESSYDIKIEEYRRVKKIAWAVNQASKYTPWESKCLVNAITAQWLLKRHNIYSTIYLGVNKDDKNKLIAHSWLRVGEIIVTGGNVMSEFKEVAKFSNYKQDFIDR
jgi:hypothetical protein